MGCRAVDADHAPEPRSPAMVFEPGAVGYVHNGHKFTGEYVCSVKEVQVNGHGTDIVLVGMGDGGTANFGLDHCSIHKKLR